MRSNDERSFVWRRLELHQFSRPSRGRSCAHYERFLPKSAIAIPGFFCMELNNCGILEFGGNGNLRYFHIASDLISDLDAFGAFIAKQLGESELSLEDSLQRFRRHQREMDELRAKVREAERASAGGDTGPLDEEETKRRVRERLAINR